MKKLILILSLLVINSVWANSFKCMVLDNMYNWDFPADEVFVEVDYGKDNANVHLFSKDKLLVRYDECSLKQVEFGGYFEAAMCDQPDSLWAYYFRGPVTFIMEEEFGVRAQVDCIAL